MVPVRGARPNPLVVFYYHWEMMNTTNENHLRIWDWLIEQEFAALFVAVWCHEAARGQRAHVVPH